MSGITSCLCPCGSKIDSDCCCAGLISGEKLPATAEALMRSRFTAYARHNDDYLLETWDSSKRPGRIDFSREDKVEWLRLDIVGVKKGGIKDLKGLVEFKAYYNLKEQEYCLHEISRFIKRNGRWFYVDGVIKSVGKAGSRIEQGRNKLCSCGSGKKFKRCCGK